MDVVELDMESRLRKLEIANFRLRRALIVVVGAVFGTSLLGAAADVTTFNTNLSVKGDLTTAGTVSTDKVVAKSILVDGTDIISRINAVEKDAKANAASLSKAVAACEKVTKSDKLIAFVDDVLVSVETSGKRRYAIVKNLHVGDRCSVGGDLIVIQEVQAKGLIHQKWSDAAALDQ